MTPNTSTAATHGMPAAQGIQRRGGDGAGAAADLESLQALFAALLAQIAPEAGGLGREGEAAPAPGVDDASGNALPPGLPPELPPGSSTELLAGSATDDPSRQLEAVLAFLTQADEGMLADATPVEGVTAVDVEASPRDTELLRLAAEMLQAQSAATATAPKADAAAAAAAIATGLVETTSATAEVARSGVPGEAREPAPLPPGLAIALAAIARGDRTSATAAGEGAASAAAAAVDSASEGRVPAAVPPPAVQQPGAQPQPAPQPMAHGTEPLPQSPPVPAGAQQILREALARAGFAASGERVSGESPQGALPAAAVSAPAGPGGADRPAPVWTVATPMHQAQQWADEVGDRVRWMVGQQLQSAELKITPPDLGTIKVRISVQQDQMSISFSSPSPQVRDTLEDAIPRLRDLMSGSGYDAVDVDVSHDRPGDSGGAPDEEAVVAATGHGNDGPSEVSETVLTRGSGALDLYA